MCQSNLTLLLKKICLDPSLAYTQLQNSLKETLKEKNAVTNTHMNGVRGSSQWLAVRPWTTFLILKVEINSGFALSKYFIIKSSYCIL